MTPDQPDEPTPEPSSGPAPTSAAGPATGPTGADDAPTGLRRLDPRRWTLGSKIGGALVVAALVPMAVLANVSSDAGREAVERAQLDSVAGSATESAVAVRQYLASVSSRADQLGTRPDVVAFLRTEPAPPVPELGEASNPDVRSLTLVDRDGTSEVRLVSGLAVPAGADVTEAVWFTEANSGRSTVAPIELDPASMLASVTVAAPVRDPGAAVEGVAALEVRGFDILNALTQTQLAAGGQNLLVADDGVVLVARDSRVVGSTLSDLGMPELAEAVATERIGTLTGVDLDGRGLQVAGFDEVSPGLTAVVLQPEAVFLGPIERLANITWIMFIVVGLLGIIAAVLVGRRLSRPVGVLTAAATSLEDGEPIDTDAVAAIGRSRDDVGRLARVFARMAAEVEARERKLREQVRALKVEIDHERRQRAVDEVTDTDFFRDLQGRAAEMRRRAKGEPAAPAGTSEAADDAASGGGGAKGADGP